LKRQEAKRDEYTAQGGDVNKSEYFKARDFSLVLGGPLFQLLRRAHLTGDALELLRRRILVISLIAWLPLLVLSALEGQALGGSAAIPFLLDVDVHVKFLVVMPLLIIAEFVVHRRLRFVVKQCFGGMLARLFAARAGQPVNS